MLLVTLSLAYENTSNLICQNSPVSTLGRANRSLMRSVFSPHRLPVPVNAKLPALVNNKPPHTRKKYILRHFLQEENARKGRHLFCRMVSYRLLLLRVRSKYRSADPRHSSISRDITRARSRGRFSYLCHLADGCGHCGRVRTG